MTNKIKQILSKNGCELFGFCRFEDTLPLLDVRSRERLPKNSRTVITILFPYLTPVKEKRNLSLYCIGEDYHDIISKKLENISLELMTAFPQNEFAHFCDISPIRETYAAYLSGLGLLGRNGLLINSKYGSFVFIGEIVCDLEFDEYNSPLGYCITCGKCIIGCPSGALRFSDSGEVFALDTAVCLSALTQKKGELTKKEEGLIRDGGLVWGCDSCQTVCPLNRGRKNTPIVEFYENRKPILTAENLDDIKDRAYGYKGKNILLRNLGILEGQSGNNKGK